MLEEMFCGRYAFEKLLDLLLPHVPLVSQEKIALTLQMVHPCYITLLPPSREGATEGGGPEGRG